MRAKCPAVRPALVVPRKWTDENREDRSRSFPPQAVLGLAFTPGKWAAHAIPYFSVPAAFGGWHGKIRGKNGKTGAIANPC
jgi:hypothetical protein